jgi:arsenite methyltransferase
VTVVAALPCDKHHWIKAGKVFAVCGNTFRMLAANRHYDLFEGVGRGCLRYVISF